MTDLVQRLSSRQWQHQGDATHWALRDEAAAEIERLRRALHDVAEEWAGAECGVPVHAQEAYAIELAQRMARMARDALAGK